MNVFYICMQHVGFRYLLVGNVIYNGDFIPVIDCQTWSLWSWLEVMLQAPFAAARSLLIEHGFGDVLIAAHGHLDRMSCQASQGLTPQPGCNRHPQDDTISLGLGIQPKHYISFATGILGGGFWSCLIQTFTGSWGGRSKVYSLSTEYHYCTSCYYPLIPIWSCSYCCSVTHALYCMSWRGPRAPSLFPDITSFQTKTISSPFG